MTCTSIATPPLPSSTPVGVAPIERANPSIRRVLAAEATGTGMLVALATGAVVAGANAGGAPLWMLAVAAFVAISLPVVLFISTSGAHINPAVTLALWAAGRFPGSRVLPYMAAQTLGALAGSAAVLWALGGALHLGATVPTDGDWAVAMAGEFGFAVLLVLSVLLLARFEPGREARSPRSERGRRSRGDVIGPSSGCSLNPARSIAPALLSGTFTDLWVDLLAVPAGALLAATVARRFFPAPSMIRAD